MCPKMPHGGLQWPVLPSQALVHWIYLSTFVCAVSNECSVSLYALPALPEGKNPALLVSIGQGPNGLCKHRTRLVKGWLAGCTDACAAPFQYTSLAQHSVGDHSLLWKPRAWVSPCWVSGHCALTNRELSKGSHRQADELFQHQAQSLPLTLFPSSFPLPPIHSAFLCCLLRTNDKLMW